MSFRRSAAYFIESSSSLGNLHELRIAVVRVAIGIGKLQRFGQRVNVRPRIQLHRSEIDAVQHVQRFDHRRPLAPEAGLVNTRAVELGRNGLLRRQPEFRHIFVAQQPLVRAAELIDLLRDLAAVEIIAYGVDRGCARFPAASAFFSASTMPRIERARSG